jgi:hypothetical protein
VRHHLKEEESKFFRVAGRLLSTTQRARLATKYRREIARMREHYAGDYGSVTVAADTKLVRPAHDRTDRPSRRGDARAGAKLRGRSEPRRTR